MKAKLQRDLDQLRGEMVAIRERAASELASERDNCEQAMRSAAKQWEAKVRLSSSRRSFFSSPLPSSPLPPLPSLRLVSARLVSPRRPSHHLASPHLTLPRLVSPSLASPPSHPCTPLPHLSHPLLPSIYQEAELLREKQTLNAAVEAAKAASTAELAASDSKQVSAPLSQGGMRRGGRGDNRKLGRGGIRRRGKGGIRRGREGREGRMGVQREEGLGSEGKGSGGKLVVERVGRGREGIRRRGRGVGEESSGQGEKGRGLRLSAACHIAMSGLGGAT